MRIPKQSPASLNNVDRLGHARAFLAGVAFLLTIFVTLAVSAQQFNQLVSFQGANGNTPGDQLVLDAAGNVYGTTFYRGSTYCSYGCGTVYKMSKHGSEWTLSSLFHFNGLLNGAHPWAGVTFGPDGALYGSTYLGGTHGEGVIFKLQPPATGCRTATCYWTETVIYNFTGGSDGGEPQGSLTFDSAGNLYGTTFYGGQRSNGGNGVVYELSPSQGGWTESVIHAFTGGLDGSDPGGGVVIDKAGNLYGTTSFGGANSLGVIYELTNGASGWTESTLHAFAGGDDGKFPTALIIDPSGNVFGATTEDGTMGGETVFELQPAGGGFNYSIIYQFNSNIAGPPPPIGGFTLDSAGNLYSCGYGGQNGGGTIFELSPSNGSWNLSVLWDLYEQQGLYPSGRPILDPKGNLYGTTEYGGRDGDGVVWQLTP